MKNSILFIAGTFLLAINSFFYASAQSQSSVKKQSYESRSICQKLFTENGYEKTNDFKGKVDLMYPKVIEENSSTQDLSDVKLTYKYESGVTPESITIFSKGSKSIALQYNPRNKSNTVIKALDKNKRYVMVASFNGTPTGKYYIFKEDVKIEDGMEIIFDQTEAKNIISIKSYDENGIELLPDLYVGKEKENGNCKELDTNSFFIHQDVGVVAIILGGKYRVKGYDIDFYVNDCSEKVHFYQTRNMLTKTNLNYFFSYDTPIVKEAILKNNPVNMFRYSQNFAFTASGKLQEHAHNPAFAMWSVYDGMLLGSIEAGDFSTVCKDGKMDLYIDLSVSSDGKYHAMVSPMMGDTEQASGYFKFTKGLPVFGNKSGYQFVDYGYEVLLGYSINEGGTGQIIYPGHPQFSFDHTQEGILFGNSCPINSTLYYVNGKNLIFKSNYIGRYGEVRESDQDKETISRTQTKDNKTNIKILNENVLIDNNIHGKTETILTYDINQEDFTPPTVQMLQFRNNKTGAITDRFDDSKDGLLLIAAGDFTFCSDEGANYPYYKYQPIELKLSYSLSEKNDWKELSYEEDKEGYHHGFGALYKANLSNINDEGEWYDLKLELKDAYGNEQIQVLKPAFKINNIPSAIHTIDNANCEDIIIENGVVCVQNYSSEAEILIFSMDGRIVATGKNKQIKIKENRGKEAYVIKAIDKGDKVITRKITL